MNQPNGHKVRRINCHLAVALLFTSLVAKAAGDANEFILINGNTHFQSVLQDNDAPSIRINAFRMQQHPITNAEYLSFVFTHSEWQRDKVAPIFANAEYLDHWQSPTVPGEHALPSQPVTRISWFAAQAYCESLHARLPTWYEWELVAAANESTQDARNDAAWRQRILDWYATPASDSISAVMQSNPNVYGVYDMHGLVWEWILDFNALMDSNEAQKFCGGGALNLQQKENFAVLMRVAMLTSLHATDTLHALGFRCARDADSVEMPAP
ncbi:MAG: formylglycine-generating enzyme family protein [Solimonas sp.]